MYSLESGQKIPLEYVGRPATCCNKTRRDALHALDQRENQDPVIAEMGFAFYRDSLIYVGRLDRDYAQNRTNTLINQYADGDVKDKQKVREIIETTVKGLLRIKDATKQPVVIFASNG